MKHYDYAHEGFNENFQRVKRKHPDKSGAALARVPGERHPARKAGQHQRNAKRSDPS